MDDYELECGKESDRGLSQANPSIYSWNGREKQLHRLSDESLRVRTRYVPNEVEWAPIVANCSVRFPAIFVVRWSSADTEGRPVIDSEGIDDE